MLKIEQMESVLESLELAFSALTTTVPLGEQKLVEAKGAVAISIMSMRKHLDEMAHKEKKA